MKFKSDIEVQAGIKDYAGSSGTAGQVLSSDGATVTWIDADIGVASDVQNEVKAGVAINKGQAVYVTSADGTNIIVGLASNTSEATSSKTLGLLNATVAANGFADVVQIGKLSGLNTIGANIGDPVWLGTNGNLIYGLANKPYAPAHLVYIGVVTRVNASNGEIFVTVQNGFELKEIHDVDLVSTTPTNNEILAFEGGSVNLWKNKTIPTVLGYTPVTNARTLTINGVTQDLSADRSWTVSGGVSGSGSVGQVAYWDGTTSITGESNLFWDSTNDRLGIGTAIPSRKLHVSATGNNGIYIQTTNEAQITMSGYDSTNSIYYCGYDGTGLYYSPPAAQINKGSSTGATYPINYYSGGDNGNNSYLSLQTQASEKMRITSGGNVGIGTTTVPNTLSVAMASSTTGKGISLTSSAGVEYARFGVVNSTVDNTSFIGSISNNNFAIYANNAERMRIFSSGNVFIGSSPVDAGYKLDVNGKLNVRDGLTGYLSGLNSYRTYTAAAQFQISSYQSKGTANYTKTMDIVANSDNGADSEIRFLTKAYYATEPQEQMRIDRFGSVSIGNTTGYTGFGLLNVSNNSYLNEIWTQEGLWFGSFSEGAANTFIYGEGANTGGQFLDFGVNFSTRIRIFDGGNVGIGVLTDAGYKLDVNGTARFSGLLQVNGPSATTRSDSDGISVFNGNVDYRLGFDSVNGTRGYIRYNVDSALSTHGHIFSAGDWNATPTDLMLIRGDGNVGIGITTGITQKLVVDGGGTDAAPIFAKSSLLYNSKYYSGILAGYATSINQSTQFGYIYDSTNAANSIAHITAYGTAEGSQFSMRANGNVGIGITTDAGYKLDVNGTVRIQNNLTVNGGQAGSYFKGGDSGVGSGIANFVDVFGVSAMYIRGDNKIGMGVTSPRAALQIDRSSWAANGVTVSRMLQKSVGVAGDYEQHVILLHPIYNGTLIGYNKCSGTIYATRGGTSMGLINDNYNLDTSSAYNTFNGTINSTIGYGRLYTCTYGGVKYMALLPDYRTSAVEYDFDGYIKSTGEELKVVVYRMSNTGTVINTEVNNSLAVYTPGITLYQGDLRTTSNFYADGNVGIGTTSPDVFGRGYSGKILGISSSGQSSIGLNSATGSGAYFDMGAGGTRCLEIYSNNTGSSISSLGARTLGLYTNGVGRLFITSGGNVLIGTATDAGYKLDVNGTARVQSAIGVNATPNATYPITIGCASGASGLKIIGRSDNLGYIEFFNNNGTTVNSSLNGSTGGLQITGATTFSSTVTATGFFQSSDIRLKEIVDYDYSISDIKPISYLWKDLRDNKKHVGYSAQEVQKVMPDAVNEDADGMLSVNYIEVLVAKIAELENRIKQLEK